MSAININTNAARLAGTTIGGSTVAISSSQTYSAGEIIGAAVDAMFTFPKASVDKWKSGSVVAALLSVNNAAFNEDLDLHLFSSQPLGETTGQEQLEVTVEDMAYYLGKIELGAPSAADADGNHAFVLERLTTPLVYQAQAENSLYGLLVARTEFTQGGSSYQARLWLDVERW